MLFAIDFDKDLIDVESIAVALVLSLQSASINGTELDTPQTSRFSADTDFSFSEEIFDIAVAQVEPVVQPNCLTDDIWRESVSFICIHPPILPVMDF